MVLEFTPSTALFHPPFELIFKDYAFFISLPWLENQLTVIVKVDFWTLFFFSLFH
jgi:hypothetical protein